MVKFNFQLQKHALKCTGQSVCLSYHSYIPFCASFFLCFLNDLVFIHSWVVSAQTSFISGRSVVCCTLDSLGFSRYPISCIYLWRRNGPEICFSFNWNAIAFCYYIFVSKVLQPMQNIPLKKRWKQETSTENLYWSEDYTSEVRGWWIREIMGLFHSGSSWISSILLQKCTSNW